MMSQDGIAENEIIDEDPAQEEPGLAVVDDSEQTGEMVDSTSADAEVSSAAETEPDDATTIEVQPLDSDALDAEVEELLADDDDNTSEIEKSASVVVAADGTGEGDSSGDDDVIELAFGAEAGESDITVSPDEPTELQDDSPESYQSHFLEEEADEPEFVAHVEDRPEPKRRVRKVLTPAAVELQHQWTPPRKSLGPAAESAVELPDDLPAEYASIEAVEPPVEEPGVHSTQPVAARISDDLFLSAIIATGGRRKKAKAEEVDEKAEVESFVGTGESDIADNGEEESGDTEVDEPLTENEPATALIPVVDAPDPQEEEDDPSAIQPTGGGFWTIPLVSVGLAMVACCVILPLIEANRKLSFERAELRRDLESVQAQVSTNDDFLRKLAGDPTLAERLAQRQMKLMRPGTRLLPVGQGDDGTSPFDLVQVTPPPALEPYQPLGGRLASLCADSRSRLYWMAGGLFVLAAGLVLGAGGRTATGRS